MCSKEATVRINSTLSCTSHKKEAIQQVISESEKNALATLSNGECDPKNIQSFFVQSFSPHIDSVTQHIKNKAREQESALPGGALANGAAGTDSTFNPALIEKTLLTYLNILGVVVDGYRVAPEDHKISRLAQLGNIRKVLAETYAYVDTAEQSLLTEITTEGNNG